VDPEALARIRDAGGDPQALLANNDAYQALQMSNDLLMTGATGTNVADLLVFLKTDSA
jgi:hydroxypyruvate reductase